MKLDCDGAVWLVQGVEVVFVSGVDKRDVVYVGSVLVVFEGTWVTERDESTVLLCAYTGFNKAPASAATRRIDLNDISCIEVGAFKCY